MQLLKLILLLTLLFTSSQSSVKKELVDISYVYQLSKNIKWHNSKKTFSIHLVSSNNSLNNQFKNLAKKMKLHGKKIVITISKDGKIPRNTDVVYITAKKNSLYKNIFEKTKNSPILLISHDYKNKKIVMINLFKTTHNTISFEINRANILSKGLGIKPEIILLGGTELDIAYLYKDTRDNLSSKEYEIKIIHNSLNKSKRSLIAKQKELSLMRKEINSFKKKNKKLKTQIKNKVLILKKTSEKIKNYNLDVEKLKKTIQERNSKISIQEKRLGTLSHKFTKTQKNLKDIQHTLELQINKQKEQKVLLDKQLIMVSKKEQHLKSLQVKIDTRTQEFVLLKNKMLALNNQLVIHEKTINKQKRILWIAITALVVFAFIVLLIGYFIKKLHQTNLLLKTTQEELRIAKNNANLENLNKSKFIASMSHELRTPLNAVLGYSQLLQKDKSFSEKHQKTFAIIRHSGEHLLGLINDILLISKIEAGHIEVKMVSSNIHEFVNSVHAMFLLKTDINEVALESIISENVPQYLLTDIDKLRQILINLLNNAVKFTKKGSIKILVDYKDENLFISIEDTGVGVAPNEIEKLFMQYEQTESGVEEGNGTGLGLALVQEFVTLFNGEVSVSSVVNQGTTFKVRIPCLEPETIVETEVLRDIVKIAPNQKEFKVLIVDDVQTNRDILAELLSLLGFQTIELVNGLEAVEWTKKNTPDIILMDLRMPVMGGREATLEILKRNKNIPIIAITASILEIEKLIEKPYPFVAAMPKPFDEKELLHLIAKFIDIKYEYDEQIEVEVKEISLSQLDAEVKEKILKAINSMQITALNRILASMDEKYLVETTYMQDLATDLDFDKLKSLLTE